MGTNAQLFTNLLISAKKKMLLLFNDVEDESDEFSYSHIVFLGKDYHLTFTCSELTIKTLEKGAKYVQS